MIGLVTYEKFPELTEDDRPLMHELAHAVLASRAVRWDDAAIDWTEFDALVLRSCWDYHLRPVEFAAWIAALDALGVPLWNPTTLVRWNLHKRYLRELERAGVLVPRTRWVTAGDTQPLAHILREEEWTAAVVKPAVSASATHTWLVSATDTHSIPYSELVATCDVLVQELIPEVAANGEWSVVMIDGGVSHAAIKRPRRDDFRVQWEHGGSAESVEVPEEVASAARHVARHIPGPWLYARVDGVVTPRGFVLMELECIEPHLFFDYRPASRVEFVNALTRRLV